MKRIAIILAAGKGVRMKSDLPKVFHKILGKPMLEYVLDAAENCKFDEIFVVVGHKSEVIKKYFSGRSVTFVEQTEQLGTGHAVMQVSPHIKETCLVVVLAGDMPFISASTIKSLLALHAKNKAKATLLTAILKEPGHYGRIIKNESKDVLRIVEAKDANERERAVKEINSGVYAFESDVLFDALKKIGKNNAQGEYYLTDVIGIAVAKGLPVKALVLDDPKEAMGINTKEELKEAEKIISSPKKR